MKNVLITGGTGFIGRQLCAFLKECGYQVSILGRQSETSDDTSPIFDGVGRYAYDGSLLSIDDCLSQVRPDCIFHLATLYIRKHQPTDVSDLIQANVLFPALLMESMSRNDVNRVVMAGSYWQFEDGHEYSPTNLYASTKQSAEAVACYYAAKKNLDIRILYISDTYGPTDPRDKLIANIYRSLAEGKPVEIRSPLATIDLVHVNDVVKALLKCATLPTGKLQRWRIQSNSTVMIADLITKIKSLLSVRYRDLITVIDSPEPPAALPAPTFAPLLPNWHQAILIDRGLASVFGGLDD